MTFAHLLLTALISVSGAATLWLALANWFDFRRTEESTARFATTSFVTLTLLSLLLCGMLFVSGSPIHVEVPWFALGHYQFGIGFVADWISAPLSALFAILCATIGVFSRRYLHREPGYQRFYFLLVLFTFAVQVTVLAGSLDVVFVGWELVGLCSALLIAYFHERRKPVEHGIRAFFTYRLCDIGLLSAVVWVHHTMGTTDFSPSQRLGAFGLPVPTLGADLTLIGLFVLLAAIGKGGQAPLGGWLPRAMEGPTPSSAIFYGAISIHLAPFLLLRASPVIQASPIATIAVIGVGAATAVHGTLVGRVQSDVKSLLAYASMTQVGLILVEIGFGFYTVALVHLMGHACIRSLQILTSPNVLQDHQHREQALGGPVPRTGGHLERLVPKSMQAWLYRHALERGYFDAVVRDFVLSLFVRTFRWLDSAERTFTSWIEGAPASASNSVRESTESHVTLDGAE
jgi:NADH-quinone oxidoreductase subunit L